MGRGKGKKGKKEEKAALKAARKAERRAKKALIPKPPKVAKPPRIRKPKPEAPETEPVPTRAPFTGTPQHVKWPGLFKKHIGVIESHIKGLDRVMQSMKSEMGKMGEQERIVWELSEQGNWRLICEMMDRAREVLVGAKKAAEGIVPPHTLRNKQGLGVDGTTYTPLGPELAARAAKLGYGPTTGGLKYTPKDTDTDTDTEMSDVSSDSSDSDSSSSSDSDSDSDSPGNAFVPLPVDNKKRKADTSEQEDITSEVESNPYFVVDTNPTPVTLDDASSRPSKKSKKDKSSKKDKKSKQAEVEDAPEDDEPEITSKAQAKVDFAAVQAQLQAEVADGLRRQAEEEAESKKSKKDKKKRKRESVGGEGVVDTKKVKEDSVVPEVQAEPEADPEVQEEKPKKEKKNKKRKAIDEEGGAVEGGSEVVEKKKKKKKHE